jgi:peptidoglycan lytic transglycosylase F
VAVVEREAVPIVIIDTSRRRISCPKQYHVRGTGASLLTLWIDLRLWAKNETSRLTVCWLLVATLCTVCAVSGCSDRRVGGLDAIREHGEIRVAVRPGFFAAPAPPSEEGDQETQLRHLAARIGAEIDWVEPRRSDQLIELLETGRADLVVARFSAAQLIGTGSVPTAPVEWVADFLVAGAQMPELSLDDLRGGRVHVQISNVSPAQRSSLEELDLEVVPVSETLSAEKLLEMVASGAIPLTLIDSGILERAPESGSVQLFGPITERRPVVWAVRGEDLQLRRAIDDFLFAEKVLTRGSKARACRDLQQIRVARVLRVVTRNSPTTCYVAEGGLEGFEYELAVEFAREQRMRLDLSIPPPGVDPLDWLEQGFGDIAILHEPMQSSREGQFLVSKPYRHVDLVSVVSHRSEASISVDDLAGVEVAASPPVLEVVTMLPLEPPIRGALSAPGTDAFSALQTVARGRAYCAVVDEDAVALEVDSRSDLVRGPVVVPDVPLVWIMNSTSPELRSRVDEFLHRARSTGLVRELTGKSLGLWSLHTSPRLPVIPEGHLTPYDEYLTWAARRNGIDWRLLASLMYEESRFDPDAVGPGGSAGLFQFMPMTWREQGVEDPHHPGEAIEAGARYLGSLMEKFADLDLPDRVAMAIASYNVGPRHVFDARKLAVEMGFDPNRWSGSVETAMYILDDPEVARRFPAGVCRCRRGAAYTRRILRRYAAYAEQFPPA